MARNKKSKPSIVVPCGNCGKEIRKYISLIVGRCYCSRNCYWDARRKGVGKPKQTGDKNPYWKGGITPLLQAIRSSAQYSDWRTSVFKFDNYVCVRCGTKIGPFNAHHIDRFSDNPGWRFDPDNGITLCEKCHNLIHTKAFLGDVQSSASLCVVRGEHACVL